MKKSFLFCAMCLMVLFGFMPKAQAQTVWDGTADISWYDASQTSFDISTPEQLAGVAQLVNGGTSFNGVTLNLTADIWLNSNGATTNNWTPIGGSATPTSEESSGGNSFRGVFNGHGHSIYNLYCDKTNYFHAGLFGCIQNPCTIDSLVMVNPTVKSCGMMGCIVGMTRSGGAIYIRYCLVINANVVGTPSGTGPSASHNNIGCIVGANYPNSNGTYVQNCGATGTVSGYYAGGLGGNCQNETFTNCYFAGSITNYNGEAGAITAYSGSRSNCYSYCTFSSSHNGGDGTAVSQAIMQSDSMISLLGDAFKVDDNNINNGYPIMAFMAGVSASATEICNGESVTLTGVGYDSYLWTPGNYTDQTITVSPSTTTTYTMTGTKSDGSTGTHDITITVYPQAVITAAVAASSDGQVHATVTPETTTVPCLSSDNVTFTITPDEGWRVASVYMNGTLVNGEEGWGPVSVTVNPGGSLANVVVNLTNAPTCIQPANLHVYDLHATSAEVMWMPATTGLPASSYNVTFINQAISDTTYDVIYDTNYSLPTLDPSTTYTIMVTASCTDNTESSAATLTFTTPALPITLPYSQDFEGDSTTTLADFEFYNNGTNQWKYGSATDADGNGHALYVSENNGANNSYNISSTSNTYAVLNIEFPADPAEYHLAFDWKGQGESSYDYLYVYLCDASVNMPSTGAPSGTDLCGRLNQQSNWQHQDIILNNVVGTAKKLVFWWRNDGSVGTQPPAAIDNISIIGYSCGQPGNFVANDISNTSVTISWTETGSSTSWNIEYGPAGFTPGSEDGNVITVYDTFYTFDNLQTATTYDFYVQADCGSEYSNFAGPLSLTPGQYIFGASGSDTLTTCNLVLYDNGGPSGDYTNSCDFYLVLYPETPGAMMAVNGTLTTESLTWDYLTIYDGVGTANQLAKIGGQNQTVSAMSTTGPLTLYFHSDGSNVYSGFELFTSCVTCYPASGLSVSNVMTTSADLSWSGAGSEFLVYLYGPNDTTVFNVYDTTVHFDNLDLNTNYAVAVQTICADGDTATLSALSSFTTPTIPANLPYTTDFEDASDNLQWGLVNGTQTNKWYIGEPTDASSDVNTTTGGANGLYISNDNGASNTYTGTTSRVYAFRDILVPDGTTELKLSFDWKAQGGSATNEFMRIYWLDPSVVTITAGNNPPSVGGVNYDLHGQPEYNTNGSHWLSQQNTWQHKEMLISAAQFAGMGNGDRIYRLYFHWRNSSYSSNPPAAVDNISVTAVTCTTPLNVYVNNVTDNGATVNWSGSANSYGVTILSSDGSQDYQTTTDTFLVLSNLNANTSYQVAVRGFCGTDSSMLSQGVQFTTACGAITSLPFFENFNTYSSMNGSNFVSCWSRHASDPSNHWVYVNPGADAYEGGSLDFHYTPNCYTMAVTPMFDPSIALNTLMIDGFTRIHLNGTAGVFEVGTMSDASDPTTFTPYDTIEYSATFTWLPFTVMLNNYTGNDHYIAFRAMNGIEVSYLLDNLTFDVIPSCFHPASASVSNIEGTSATISWNGTSDNYVLEYGPAGFAQGSGTYVNVTNAMSYTLTGLNPTTQYTVYIYSDCGSDGLSTAISVNFQTTMVAVNLPYTTDFTTDQAWELNNGTCTNHWMMGIPSGETQSALFITSDNSTAGYNTGSASTVMAEKLFYMPGTDSVHVEFDVRIGGESSWDYFKVFLCPSTEIFTAGTGQNTQSSYSYSTNALDFSAYKSFSSYSSYNYMLNLTNGNTVHVSVNMPNPDLNGQGKIVFLWRNDSSTGDMPGAVVSNFAISETGSGPVVTNPTVATNAADNLAADGATLHATITNPDNVTITAKGFEWKATTGGTYTQIVGTGTGNTFTANLTGLAAATGYTFRAFITFNSQTVYGNEQTFTTLNEDTPEPCDVPTGVTATDITASGATITWDNNPDVNSWNIQYRPQNGQLTSATSNTNSYTITNLTASTTYDVQVQAVCDDNNTSEWTAAYTFTTTTGLANHLENSVTLFPNPAKEYVDIRIDGDLNITMMEVYDVYGKLVNTVNGMDNPTRINVTSLADGMYFVRVTTEEGTVTKSFVKR